MDIYCTSIYKKWITRLKDKNAKTIIRARLYKIEKGGSLGDYEVVSKNVLELRFHIGPGYRIYLTVKERKMIILLVGGDKSTQTKDIKKAEVMASKEIVEGVVKWY